MWLHKNHRNSQSAKAPAHPTSDHGTGTPSAETGKVMAFTDKDNSNAFDQKAESGMEWGKLPF